MTDIPQDIMASAIVVADSEVNFGSYEVNVLAIARAILAERQRCVDWCEKTAFLEWEQGELRAQRALDIARDNILSGDDA